MTAQDSGLPRAMRRFLHAVGPTTGGRAGAHPGTPPQGGDGGGPGSSRQGVCVSVCLPWERGCRGEARRRGDRQRPRKGGCHRPAALAPRPAAPPPPPPPPRAVPAAATHGLLLLMVSSKLLRSRTLECSPAAAMSRTWSITFILPRKAAAGSGGGGGDAESRPGAPEEPAKMAAAPGSFGVKAPARKRAATQVPD